MQGLSENAKTEAMLRIEDMEKARSVLQDLLERELDESCRGTLLDAIGYLSDSIECHKTDLRALGKGGW